MGNDFLSRECIMFQADLIDGDGRMTDKNTEKKTRKKRRVPGSATPPRISITLRLEVDTLNGMTALLALFDGSRNDYISKLIDDDLQRSKRFHSSTERGK